MCIVSSSAEATAPITQIIKQIEAHKEKLNVLMDETMMPIGDIKIEVIKESIVKKVPQSKETLSRMDFRI